MRSDICCDVLLRRFGVSAEMRNTSSVSTHEVRFHSFILGGKGGGNGVRVHEFFSSREKKKKERGEMDMQRDGKKKKKTHHHLPEHSEEISRRKINTPIFQRISVGIPLV